MIIRRMTMKKASFISYLYIYYLKKCYFCSRFAEKNSVINIIINYKRDN